ncbi:hypothetical protein D3C81_1627770 [compost metagenome]
MADHGFAHGGERLGQVLQHFVLIDAQLLVPGAVVAGDQVGVFELVAALAAGILEADGEGRQLLHTGFRQQAHQQAGVHATGKQHADFAGGALADRHGVAQAGQQQVAPVLEAQYLFVFAGAVFQLPPDALTAVAVGVYLHPAGRRQFFDAFDQGARRRHHGVEVEVEVQRLRVQRGIQVATLEQGRQARGEAQPLVVA